MQVLAPPAIAVRPRARAPGRARSQGPWRVDEGVLEDLARLTAGEGARRRALAAVAGRLVATRACERLGFARLRDYAVERVGVSVRQLQERAWVDAALVERPVIEAALAQGLLDPSGLADLPAGLQTGASPRGSRTRVCSRFGAPRSVVQLFRAVLARVQRRLEQRLGRTSSDGEAFEAMLEHALESWGLDRPLARKYAVFERDGWRCTVPGCTAGDTRPRGSCSSSGCETAKRRSCASRRGIG